MGVGSLREFCPEHRFPQWETTSSQSCRLETHTLMDSCLHKCPKGSCQHLFAKQRSPATPRVSTEQSPSAGPHYLCRSPRLVAECTVCTLGGCFLLAQALRPALAWANQGTSVVSGLSPWEGLNSAVAAAPVQVFP